MHALAGARRFTGKRKVVVFSGGYHGAVFSFWNGVQENGVDKDEWVIGKYNDLESAKAVIEKDDIAAVLVEGMQGAGGCIPGTREFLQQVQASAKKVLTRSSTAIPLHMLTSSRSAPSLFSTKS